MTAESFNTSALNNREEEGPGRGETGQDQGQDSAGSWDPRTEISRSQLSAAVPLKKKKKNLN